MRAASSYEALPPPERSAAVLAGLTVLSRVMGFVRVVAITAILGVTYLGNAYASANSVPNLLFEIVAGGALAAVLVPALAAPMSRRDPADVDRTASAFINLTLVVLTPVVVVGIALREPLMEWLTSGVADEAVRSAQIEVGKFLLLVFLPQIWLYGLAVVLTGILHAHHRFAGPALAPLLNSVVVTVVIVAYGLVEGPSASDLGSVSRTGVLILGFGTTAGVAVLSLSLLLPVRRLAIKWRPFLRIPKESARIARRLLGAAVVAVGGQQLLLAVVLVIANRVEGGVVAYQLAFTVLLLPWAVLAVPLAVASFPGLAAAIADGRDSDFARRCSDSSRMLIYVSFGGAALLAGTSRPLAAAVVSLTSGGGASAALIADAIAAFAPGMVGYGAYAFLSRVAYARGDGRSPAIAAAVGFGLGVIGDLLAALFIDGPGLIAALAASFSFGMIAGSLLLYLRLRRAAGSEPFLGVGVSLGRGVVAAAVAGLAGFYAAAAIGSGPLLVDIVAGALSGAVVVVVFVGVQMLMGDRDLGRTYATIRGVR